MEDKIKKTVAEQGWAKAVIFDHTGKIIASTIENVKSDEIKELLKAFDDEERTFRSGITIDGDKFDVHRFYDKHDPPLIYGRRGKPQNNDGEGFCLCKTNESKTYSAPIYTIITYGFPCLSARAVPELIKFCKENLS